MKVYRHHCAFAFVCSIASTTVANEVAKRIGQLGQGQPKAARIAEAQSLAGLAKQPDALKAIPALTLCLGDADVKLREEAVRAMAIIAYKHKNPCPLGVVQALLDSDAGVRLLAQNYLIFKKYPNEARPLLLRALGSKDPFVRAAAAMPLAYGWGKDAQVLAALKKASKDKNLNVKGNAYAALWHATSDATNEDAPMAEPSSDRQVFERLEKLDRRCRRLTWLAVIGSLLAAIVSVTCYHFVLRAGLLAGPATVQAEQLIAGRLVLRDSSGVDRVLLEADGSSSRILLLDHKGHLQAKLFTGNGVNSGLELRDSGGKNALVRLVSHRDVRPGGRAPEYSRLQLFAEKTALGQPLVRLTTQDHGCRVELHPRQKSGAILYAGPNLQRLDLFTFKGHGAGLSTSTEQAKIELTEKDGTPVFVAPKP